MLFLVRALYRRIVAKQKGKRNWFTRLLMIIAAVKWIDSKLNGPRVVYLKKNERLIVTSDKSREHSI